MREKKVLSKYLIYNYTELDALKEYLEEMALQGWILTDINTWITFRKAEPQKIIYSVEIDENAGFYDRFIKIKEIENLEECLEHGWVLVAGVGKLRVYKTKNENAIPINKDEKAKLERIVSSTIKQRAIIWFFLPFIFIFNLILLNINHSNSMEPIKYLGNTFYLLFYALIVAQIISFLVWRNKAKKRVGQGGNVNIYSLKYLKYKNNAIKIAFVLLLIFLFILAILSTIFGNEFAAISLLFLIAFIFIILLASAWIQRMRLSSSSTLLLSIGVGVGLGILIIVIAMVIAFSTF